MSRIGKIPITLPGGVTATLADNAITVTGPNGSLNQPVLSAVKVEIEGSEVKVSPLSDAPMARANQGLMRSLINNMVTGVSSGFEKKLEINGVGYRAQQQGADLKLSLGFSHDIDYRVSPGVKVAVDQNIITVSGPDKQQVGQVAAEIRALKKPEPYKGKGIKYLEEQIIRKSGKSGKEAAA